MLKKIGLLFLILLASVKVNAICSTEDFNVLKEKAKKVEISYDYTLEEDSDFLQDKIIYAYYTLTAHNLDESLLVEIKTSSGISKIFKKNKSNIWEVKDLEPGKVTIIIKGNTNNCNDMLKTEYLNLLYYNNFYNNEKCREYPLFKYCQNEFEMNNLYNINFDKELDLYIKEDKTEKHKKQENNFLEKYFVIILSIIIFTIVIVIIYIKIRNNMERNSL